MNALRHVLLKDSQRLSDSYLEVNVVSIECTREKQLFFINEGNK